VEVRGGKGEVMEGGRVRCRGKEKEKERGEEGRRKSRGREEKKGEGL
jgi:hypothetical protein